MASQITNPVNNLYSMGKRKFKLSHKKNEKRMKMKLLVSLPLKDILILHSPAASPMIVSLPITALLQCHVDCIEMLMHRRMGRIPPGHLFNFKLMHEYVSGYVTDAYMHDSSTVSTGWIDISETVKDASSSAASLHLAQFKIKDSMPGIYFKHGSSIRFHVAGYAV